MIDGHKYIWTPKWADINCKPLYSSWYKYWEHKSLPTLHFEIITRSCTISAIINYISAYQLTYIIV